MTADVIQEHIEVVDGARGPKARIAGHRIRVQVSGGAFPRYARNFGTGQPFAAATTAVRCRFEIHHDSRHPACVLLPVLR